MPLARLQTEQGSLGQTTEVKKQETWDSFGEMIALAMEAEEAVGTPVCLTVVEALTALPMAGLIRGLNIFTRHQ